MMSSALQVQQHTTHQLPCPPAELLSKLLSKQHEPEVPYARYPALPCRWSTPHGTCSVAWRQSNADRTEGESRTFHGTGGGTDTSSATLPSAEQVYVLYDIAEFADACGCESMDVWLDNRQHKQQSLLHSGLADFQVATCMLPTRSLPGGVC